MKNNSLIVRKGGGGLPLLFFVLGIAIFGTVMIYSASCYTAEKDYGNKFYFVTKQAVGLIIGLASMIFCYKFNYKKLQKSGLALYIFGVVLLALVFVPFLSVEVYGAKRWIKLFFITIQPSEIAKFCFIIFTASYFSRKPERISSFKGILPVVIAGCVMCVLIILEPNMSITMCVALLMLGLLFASGIKFKHLCVFIVPVLLAVPLLIAIEPYRLKRFSAFINPWASPKGEGYQLIQSLYALGSGGWFGIGLFNSRQKYKFLPFSESDFILSVIGEELGFFGVLTLFLFMGYIVCLGLKTALNTKDLFGYLLSVGITLIYAIQIAINALVVTGSIPPTGLPLPLISAGNTSLIVYMAAFGLLAGISERTDFVRFK